MDRPLALPMTVVGWVMTPLGLSEIGPIARKSVGADPAGRAHPGSALAGLSEQAFAPDLIAKSRRFAKRLLQIVHSSR